MPGHEYQDRVSLEAGRRIAAALPDHPEWIDLARANLRRWSERNAGSPWSLRNYAEWEALLDQPVAGVCAALTDDSDTGRRRRQNSPFTGILTPREVWDMKKRIRDDPAAA